MLKHVEDMTVLSFCGGAKMAPCLQGGLVRDVDC